MAYEMIANVSTAPIRSSSLVAGCLRALAGMAERRRRQAALRDELDQLTEALKRDIGLTDG